MRIARIVSGGQSGADRAALDAAREAGVDYGGWCPVNGWAEDLPEPPGLLADYPLLREAPSSAPAERTRLNVRDSDVTLVVWADGVASPGSDLTVAVAKELGRPWLATVDAAVAARWLGECGSGLVVNVAGPRESEQPGSYALTRALVADVLEDLLREPGHLSGEPPILP